MRNSASTGRVVGAERGGIVSGEADATASIQNALRDVALAVAEGKVDTSVYDFLSGLVRTKPCDDRATLKPTKGWKDETACENALGGDNDTCEATVCTRTYVEFASMDIEAASKNLKIRGATEEEEEFIRTAWALLYHNTDLIRWVSCWLFGKDDDEGTLSWWEILFPVESFVADLVDQLVAGEHEGECLVGLITGGILYDEVTVIVRDEEKWWMGLDFSPEGNTYTDSWADPRSWIHIFRTDSLDLWDALNKHFFSSVEKERLCGAIALAVTLFHETMHLCLREVLHPRIHNSNAEPCDVVYMGMQMFQYALVQRYPSSGWDPVAVSACGSYTPFLDDEHLQFIAEYIASVH